jgi:hypothetical protein
MKIQKPLSVLVNGCYIFLSALAVFSCGSKSELSNHIPKDANVVMAFDVKSMSLKALDFKQMLSFENIREALGSLGTNDTTENSFENSGIDFLNKAYFFMKTNENGQYGAAVAALSDASKFETFIKNADSDLVVTQEGDFKFAVSEAEKMAVAWNATKAILLFGGDNPKETLSFLANLKDEESLGSQSKTFDDLENQAADISLWVSFEGLDKLVPQYGMANPGINLAETFLTAACNFEDGQIVIDSKYISNEEMSEKFAFVKPSVSEQVAGQLPGKSVVGMLGFALDMEMVYAYLEEQNLIEAYGASSSQMTGLTVKEFLTMLTGDIAVTVNGMEMKEVKSINWATGEEIMRKQPEPDYCAIFGIAEKERASQMLAKFAENGMLTKTDNYYSFQDKLFVIEKEGSLVLTGTAATKQFILDGTGEKLNDELKGMLTGNATSIYVNPNNVSEEVYAYGSPLVGSNIKNSEVEDILFTSSTVKDNVTDSKILIRFRAKDENSLVTLGRISKKISEEWARQAQPPAAFEPAAEVVSVP